MSRHLRHLSQAVAVATSSRHPKWPMGTVLIRGGSVISAAPNRPRTHPRLTGGMGSSIHAELAALLRVKGATDGLTAYVARVNRRGDTRLARPCSACLTELLAAGVRMCVYTTDVGYAIERLGSIVR